VRHNGFTLIEVLLALVIAGTVLLAAERIFAGVGDGSQRLVAAREQIDRAANGRRSLKSAFLSLEVGQVTGEGFEGRADRVRFTSWQMTPGGWFTRQATDLGLNESHLVATIGGLSLVLGDSVAEVAFDYLLDPGAESRWVREWISPVSAPLAVRMRIGRKVAGQGVTVDTLLFLIKERG